MSKIYGGSMTFGGGIECYLIINTENGNGSSVTAVLGSHTVTGTVSNEQCILKVPSKGDWSITVTSPTYGTSQTKTIYVGDGSGIFTMCPQFVLDCKNQAVGTTVTADGYQWIIVHKTATAATLGLRYWYMDTTFGSIPYAGSNIANLAATFESNTLSAITKTFLNNVTVNGVTAKVFIPSYEQVDSGFAHYNSNTNRIFTDSSGTTKTWLTSSVYGQNNMYFVSADGSLRSDRPFNPYGFRPHMEVNLPA